MAIRLHLQENRVRLKVNENTPLRLKATQGIPIYPEAYTGATRVTPSQEEQVLLTGGLYVAEHIHVDPIPSNYGLITYNGSIITVS